MRKTLVTILAIAGTMSSAAFAADREIKVDDRLDASADTLTEMMHADDKGIPQDLLDKAHCVVVIPGMKKAGFIFGAKYGRGFAVCREHGRSGWSAPAAMRIEGGSVGFQIGASETDVILLVMNDGGMKHLLSDKFTIGGDATAAADPSAAIPKPRRMRCYMRKCCLTRVRVACSRVSRSKARRCVRMRIPTANFTDTPRPTVKS